MSHHWLPHFFFLRHSYEYFLICGCTGERRQTPSERHPPPLHPTALTVLQNNPPANAHLSANHLAFYFNEITFP